MQKEWFVIVNPTSGNGASIKKWPAIKQELNAEGFQFEYQLTEYNKHSIKIIEKAINQGFKKFICVGGDGTLHNIVNGILSIDNLDYSEFQVGIIPIGTGNDWVKTYRISKNYKTAIQTLKNNHVISQDIGKISLHDTNQSIYFNNLSGIGFDGYVVYKVNQYKQFGFLAYLIGALTGLGSYKKSELKITFNNEKITGEILMLLVGICKFSGGGMQLTSDVDPRDGLFDISCVSSISPSTVIKNLKGLFTGSITKHSSVKNYKTNYINVEILTNKKLFMQADGELISAENFSISLIPKALHFIVPE